MTVVSEIVYGSITIEIEASDASEFQSELLSIVEFLENNESQIRSAFGGTNSPKLTESESEESRKTMQPNVDGGTPEPEQSDGPLSELASQLRVPKDELTRYFIIDGDEDYPILYLQDKTILSDQKTQRQRKTALILLYLWNECYGEERVKSSDLKDAIQMSGISHSNLANIYQGEGNNLFDRSGRGASATVGLTLPGKREAKRVIDELIDQISDISEENENEENRSSLNDF